MTFNDADFINLKRREPKAKNFVFMRLPDGKEVSFTVQKGASLKKSVQAQLMHLKTKYEYEPTDIQVETYDLLKK